MYNKLSPFISLGLRRFPPSALQQVLVWWGLSDGISAGCVVGINDLLKTICPPKVTHMHTRARVPQPYVHPDSSHNDRTNYNILCGLGVCECVCLSYLKLSLSLWWRETAFFVLALQELRWSVSVCVWPSRKKPNETVWICYITSYVKLDWFLQCYQHSLETSRVACVGRLCTGTFCVQGCITLI